MTRLQYRLLAVALAVITLIAGLAAYFSSRDTVTNTFGSAVLTVRVTEPKWVDNPTVVPEQQVDKDPYIVNTNETPAYVFMQVTVPAAEVILENAAPDSEKGSYNSTSVLPLFRFVDSDGVYTASQTGTEQAHNTGWYHMKTTENKNSDKETVSYTYLYAWTGDNAGDTMAVLYPSETTDTPLFNRVLFCNAREDDSLPGSEQRILIEVFGIQSDYLKSSEETESKAENVWKILSA